MVDILKEEELLNELNRMKLAFESFLLKKNPPTDEIIKLQKQAYQQIKEMIQKFSEECVKSYKTGYKAGVVNENTRMRKNQPEVTEEWIEEKAKELAYHSCCHPVVRSMKSTHPVWENVNTAKDFIRSLVEEILAKKPIVTKDWIEEEVVKLFAKHNVRFPTPKMLRIFEEFVFLQDSLIRNREKVTGG